MSAEARQADRSRLVLAPASQGGLLGVMAAALVEGQEGSGTAYGSAGPWPRTFEGFALPDHSGASCHGSSSTLQPGARQRSRAQARNWTPSSSVTVTVWRSWPRTIHGRSGSYSVTVLGPRALTPIGR